jgi:hypothetical protein
VSGLNIESQLFLPLHRTVMLLQVADLQKTKMAARKVLEQFGHVPTTLKRQVPGADADGSAHRFNVR